MPRKILGSLFLCIFHFANSVSAREVVIVGDSLTCGPFGKHILNHLAKAEDDVTLYCAVSSEPFHWWKGMDPPKQHCRTMTGKNMKLRPCNSKNEFPRISSILPTSHSGKVIIALGTNSVPRLSADFSYGILALLIRIRGHQCLWIGPPQFNPEQSKGFPKGRVAKMQENLDSFYDSMSGAFGPYCELMDSRAATAPGTPGFETMDGVHRTELAGKYWAEQLFGIYSPDDTQLISD